MTWKEFKDEVERMGVKDDDAIQYIDVGDIDADCINIKGDEKERMITT